MSVPTTVTPRITMVRAKSWSTASRPRRPTSAAVTVTGPPAGSADDRPARQAPTLTAPSTIPAMIGPRSLRIAILGTRGVPARYGGFETLAEQLGARLVERGHHVTVYGRHRWVRRSERVHRGMAIVRLPAPRSKYLET